LVAYRLPSELLPLLAGVQRRLQQRGPMSSIAAQLCAKSARDAARDARRTFDL